MTISPRSYDLSGNMTTNDGSTIAWDSMTNVAIPGATQPSVCAGTGAPTFSAKKGTLYINLTGSSTATRLYVNTDGATTWTNFTSAA
jgi:hypothetical protein